MTWKIVAGIHWEVLKLRLRGTRFRSTRPPPNRSATGSRQRRSDLANDPREPRVGNLRRHRGNPGA
ncbi:hypothetical protein [Mesorhizobium sp. CO1-1-8]|uniref:hypothetical protein n=1 Tax=Mesorhizobium sp. CO1-1-8 TaxID=2876631 RepID=UPI00398F31CE